MNHQLNTCNVHALPNLAAFQRKGKVVGDVTAGSLLKMLGEPALCCCSAAASPVLLRLFLQLVIRPLAAEAGGMQRLSCPRLSM